MVTRSINSNNGLNRKRKKYQKWECVYMYGLLFGKTVADKRTVIMGFGVDLKFKLVFGFEYFFKLNHS